MRATAGRGANKGESDSAQYERVGARWDRRAAQTRLGVAYQQFCGVIFGFDA